MNKLFLKTAALLGALSVILGAFAAHKLKEIFTPDNLSVFETAVRYQFYHVFALLAVGILYANFPSAKTRWAGYLFITGIILFSGSLYLLCYLKYSLVVSLGWVGAITPIGGAAFIAGWGMLFLAISKK
jgi:uncharacterized membrane protein YgdD (TMEM256/DUF423 family)